MFLLSFHCLLLLHLLLSHLRDIFFCYNSQDLLNTVDVHNIFAFTKAVDFLYNVLYILTLYLICAVLLVII